MTESEAKYYLGEARKLLAAAAQNKEIEKLLLGNCPGSAIIATKKISPGLQINLSETVKQILYLTTRAETLSEFAQRVEKKLAQFS